MPTYEYECLKCGHQFEQFQSITAKPLKTCPKCGKKVRRLLGSGAGIIFKGSGFYQTDYRSKNYREQAKKETGDGASKKEEKKTESSTTKDSKHTSKKTTKTE
jgi:putative FmdB family regulatory protein